ncbi:MAG: YidC/Oxa1 family membrane protein insertase [bacterium]|nr:YidC/Oxa1 family membrane protein insertase [bacterium]MDZ4344134.1 YidC/Oxa1 family membrane protein insertase [Candidatus Binatia bacterium]
MNIISVVYTEALFRPLYNLLVGITDFLPNHSVGFAILLVTLIVRLILLPSALHQAKMARRNQDKMQSLQKELKKIKEQHKEDKTKQAEATMRLYRQAGINPASGCLPLLIQLPILIALYRVFFTGLGEETFQYLYSFVPAPSSISAVFLGIDLSIPSLLLGVIAGLGQFAMMRFFSPSPAAQPGANESTAQMMASMQKNMTYFFPVMTIFIAMRLPAALALYWVASTAFAIIQQYFIKRALNLSSNPPIV